MKTKILITGVAGFIGFNVARKLLNLNYKIIGIDNLNNYYNPQIKKDRLKNLPHKNFIFYKSDIRSKKLLEKIFKKHKPEFVLNLAAQAGVRYSIKKPKTYLENNIDGFLNILDLSVKYSIKHLVYASSSSVYGLNNNFPLSTNNIADHPLAMYAVSKRTNELMAHAYSYLYNLPTTGLRYFTVYGPWGRPDMALFKFVKLGLQKKTIPLFNYGNHIRDFTYIDDAVEFTKKAIFKIPDNRKKITNYSSKAKWLIYNVCSSKPVKLKKFIEEIEKNIKTKIKFKNLKLQSGDVIKTHGSNKITVNNLKYVPKINYKIGIKRFVEWYREYYI
jgi:UDP-glucuronate 4-epimerase